LSLFSSKGIRFSGDSIKSCVGFIDLIDSTKNTITMEGLDYIRRYYSTFTNSIASLVSSSRGKVIKNTGDCILFYFPKIYEINDTNAFQHGIECCFKILDDRLLSIVPGVSKKQIMRKPVNKKLFTNTVNNLLN
jgi:hypothetical protein